MANQKAIVVQLESRHVVDLTLRLESAHAAFSSASQRINDLWRTGENQLG